MERAGAEPADALALARAITKVRGVEFAGLMTWEGHTMGVEDPAERERAIQTSVQKVLDAADQIREAGIPVGIVSTGGTGTYLISGAMKGVTEVQAGGGIFGDEVYVELEANVKPALTLLAQVTSRPTPTRVIVDCGRKSVDPSVRAPKPRGIKIAKDVALSAEHGTLTLAEASTTPKVGDRVAFGIGYSDQILHLHEVMYSVRDGIVIQVIPVAGRGRLQ
jgi:D-serine deaminase-like pyridoxal phosphate-dependent protein